MTYKYKILIYIIVFLCLIYLKAYSIDLILKDLEFSPQHPYFGEVIKISALIYNNSDKEVKTDIKFFLNNIVIGYRKIKIKAYNNYSMNFEIVPSANIGTYKNKLIAIVDPYNKLKDINRANNVLIKKLEFVRKDIDLTITKINFKRNFMYLGDWWCYVEVKNNGKDTAENVFIFYYVNNKPVGMEYIKELKGNQSKTVKRRLKIHKKGKYKIKIIIDKDNFIRETNKKNNEKTSILYYN